MNDRLSLSELAGIIKNAVSDIAMDYWVTAEISSANVHRQSRHCYLELVEKEDETLIAQMRAVIWAKSFSQIDREFRRATGRTLEPGMQILLRARPVFHEIYGISLGVTAVDPAYTLGGIAILRKKIIDRLTVEGIIDLNRELTMPVVPQRIAVISSATAAGYGDFMQRLMNNAQGYEFSVELFEAYVQGDQAERSILSALDRCRRRAREFDIVALIRGGGSQVDLQSFDSYGLARAIALFPLPVLTGIGHERDETVLDRVANSRMITPTATADFLISLALDFENSVDELSLRLAEHVRRLLGEESSRIDRNSISIVSSARSMLAARRHDLSLCTQSFRHGAIQIIGKKDNRLDRALDTLDHQSRRLITGHIERLSRMELSVALLDPVSVLGRGYSITSLNGRALTEQSQVGVNDIITTRLFRGSITSTVNQTKGEPDNGRQ